jgi:hypothetical protein
MNLSILIGTASRAWRQEPHLEKNREVIDLTYLYGDPDLGGFKSCDLC